MKDILDIMVAVPCGGTVSPRCVETLFGVAAHSRKWCRLDVRFFRGYSCAMARNRAAAEFLGSGADYLWYVDSDIMLPEDSLRRLVNIGAEIASGVYFRKETGEERKAEVFRMEGEQTVVFTEGEVPGGVFEASAVGFGCVLVSRAAMERCMAAGGGRPFVYSHDPLISEDLWFCNIATQLGYRVMVDGGLRLGHEGSWIY